MFWDLGCQHSCNKIYNLLFIRRLQLFSTLLKVLLLLPAFYFDFTYYLNSLSHHEWLNSIWQQLFFKNCNTKYKKTKCILQQKMLKCKSLEKVALLLVAFDFLLLVLHELVYTIQVPDFNSTETEIEKLQHLQCS